MVLYAIIWNVHWYLKFDTPLKYFVIFYKSCLGEDLIKNISQSDYFINIPVKNIF